MGATDVALAAAGNVDPLALAAPSAAVVTTANAGDDKDAALFAKLGVVPMQASTNAHLEAAE